MSRRPSTRHNLSIQLIKHSSSSSTVKQCPQQIQSHKTIMGEWQKSSPLINISNIGHQLSMLKLQQHPYAHIHNTNTNNSNTNNTNSNQHGYQNQLASNLQIITSKQYQDLLSKIRMVKQQKQIVIAQLTKHKKQSKLQIKNLFKDKTKVKMDIWEKIGAICKLKDQITVQKQRKQMLDQFFSQQRLNQQGNQAVDRQYALSSRQMGSNL